MMALRRHFPSRRRNHRRTMPGLRQRERREHADDVELDQPRELGVVHVDQQAGEARQDQHAVGEDEPVPAVAELRGHEPVAREDRRQAREVLERRVGREHEDPCREDLQQDEHEPVAEHRLADLRQHRLLVQQIRRDAHLEGVGEDRDAEEHRDGHRAHDGEGLRRVPRLGAAEGLDPVGDRLHAGERGGAGRERAQQQEQAERHLWREVEVSPRRPRGSRPGTARSPRSG